MTLSDFISKYNGKKNDFDGAYGSQCFDLFQFYNRDMFGGGFVPGNGAVDIWSTYPTNIYDKVPNTPTGVPTPGDVMIWGTNYGPYGHVAIVTRATVDNFTCLSQNDPAGRETYLKDYPNYNGVLGWLHPKAKVVVDTIPTVDDCPAKLTQVTQERDRLNGVITSKDETIQNLNTTINDKNNQITKLNSDISTLQTQVTDLTSRVSSLTEQSLKVKPLEDQVDELERQKKMWTDIEGSYKQQINGYKTKWELIKLPYTKLLKRLLIDKLL